MVKNPQIRSNVLSVNNIMMLIKTKLSVLVVYLIFIHICSSNSVFAQPTTRNPKIDSHIHLYDTQREGSCSFLSPEKHAKIYSPHLPVHFVQTASPAGVQYAIVVEASKRREDNDWLINTVNQSEAMLACILNLDPRHPEFHSDIQRYLKHPKFRGVRIRPKNAIDLSQKEIIEALGILEKHNLVLELGHKQESVEDILLLASKYPNLTIVINHLAGGKLKNGQVVPMGWYKKVAELANAPNIVCKVSAIYTLAGQTPARKEMLFYSPLIDPVVKAFGPKRVFFGSNWTLSEMKGSYGEMVQIMNDYCTTNEKLAGKDFYYRNILDVYDITLP